MKKRVLSIFLSLFLCLNLFSVNQSSTQSFYAQACSAFYKGDWNTAVFLLRKTVSDYKYNTADVNYMLINAEIYSGDLKAALSDCDEFLISFPKSVYKQRMQFTKGKLLFNLGEYEKAIICLSDFCHQNEKHELYPTALFYIAESLYQGLKYDEAEKIYENIITNYPSSEKAVAAQYRMESIAQRSREEKLLYLLKQTGEEYLSAKEDYEKQVKISNSDTITREKLFEYQQKNKDMEEQIQELESQINELKILQAQKDEQLAKKEAEEELRKKQEQMMQMNLEQEKLNEIQKLKQKAKLVEELMNEGAK